MDRTPRVDPAERHQPVAVLELCDGRGPVGQPLPESTADSAFGGRHWGAALIAVTRPVQNPKKIVRFDRLDQVDVDSRGRGAAKIIWLAVAGDGDQPRVLAHRQLADA